MMRFDVMRSGLVSLTEVMGNTTARAKLSTYYSVLSCTGHKACKESSCTSAAGEL